MIFAVTISLRILSNGFAESILFSSFVETWQYCDEEDSHDTGIALKQLLRTRDIKFR